MQERAWTSPIWYTPTAEARKTARTGGVSIADLRKSGVTSFTDAELAELVVGKDVWLKNAVTGAIFGIAWETGGQRTFRNINPRDPQPQHFGFAAEDSYLGVSTAYTISNGRIMEDFGDAPLSWTAYKSGDKTLLARSDEFGFANYEVIPVPVELVDLASVKR